MWITNEALSPTLRIFLVSILFEYIPRLPLLSNINFDKKLQGVIEMLAVYEKWIDAERQIPIK